MTKPKFCELGHMSQQGLLERNGTVSPWKLEHFSGKRQDVTHLHVFGAKCWAKILAEAEKPEDWE
jgi:hypothetical protein